MKSLLLSGYNIHLGVDDGKLKIKDGKDWEKDPTVHTYKPRMIDLDQIVIYGQTGNVTISAIKWLMKHKIPIQVIDYDGKLLTTMNPPQTKNGFAKMGQYKAHQDNRIEMAKKFIDAKIRRSDEMMQWLILRYHEVEKHYNMIHFEKTLEDLKNAKHIKGILGIEGIVARHYWDALADIFPEKYEFEKRGLVKSIRPNNAVDPINSLFNYGYSVLEGICLKGINQANLDPYIGFVHEIRYNKSPLVYDLMEPFRWLIDKTIIEGLENNLYHKNDFIRTDDYIIRLRPKGVKKLVNEIDKTFSQTIKYRGINQQWGNIIQLKTQELSNYIQGKRKCIDFTKPLLKMERIDGQDLRDKILSIPYGEWVNMGMNKSTLHYLKKNAKENKSFNINTHVLKILNSI